MLKVILLELNEINFDVVNFYIEEFLFTWLQKAH